MTTLAQTAAVLPTAAAILAKLDRRTLSQIIEVAVDLLDAAEGDADAEDEDDDACLAADDDPKRHVSDRLPGDPTDIEPVGDEEEYSPGGPSGRYGEDQRCAAVLAPDSSPARPRLALRFKT